MGARVEELMVQVLRTPGAVEIRDVGIGEEPFLYSSGNWGPGYVSIKGLVSRGPLIVDLTHALGERIMAETPPDFVAANVNGGMIPGWVLSQYLKIPYVYVRETRKAGGQQEHITGLSSIPQGATGLVVEELVNFAQTTCNSAEVVRSAGHEVTHGACILYYGNPEATKALQEHGLQMVHLFTLPELLDCAEHHETHSRQALVSYREYLQDPLGWQAKRGLEPVASGGTR